MNLISGNFQKKNSGNFIKISHEIPQFAEMFYIQNLYLIHLLLYFYVIYRNYLDFFFNFCFFFISIYLRNITQVLIIVLSALLPLILLYLHCYCWKWKNFFFEKKLCEIFFLLFTRQLPEDRKIFVREIYHGDFFYQFF